MRARRLQLAAIALTLAGCPGAGETSERQLDAGIMKRHRETYVPTAQEEADYVCMSEYLDCSWIAFETVEQLCRANVTMPATPRYRAAALRLHDWLSAIDHLRNRGSMTWSLDPLAPVTSTMYSLACPEETPLLSDLREACHPVDMSKTPLYECAVSSTPAPRR
jgi:hypothetical protein